MIRNKNLPETSSVIYDNVSIGTGVKIGHGAIIYPNTVIGDNTIIGPYSAIGEPAGSFYSIALGDIEKHDFKKTVIGPDSVIRSHSIIYEDVVIGARFQSGHRVTIREKTVIGVNCSIGTLSDIQDQVLIGDYVRVHSNVFMGQLSRIEDYVWIYPSVVLTNDPLPPHGRLKGVLLKKYSQVFASSTILPGIVIGENALVGAHSVVTKNVDDETLVVGNPAKVRCNIRDIKDENGNQVYPWKDHLKEYRGYPWQAKD